MAKTVYVTLGWQQDAVPTTLKVQDDQSLRNALGPFLPAGVAPNQLKAAIDETGTDVIDQLGKQLKEGSKIQVSKADKPEGGKRVKSLPNLSYLVADGLG